LIAANDFIPLSYTHTVESGIFNGAHLVILHFVKYWGKKENQIPANPVSFT
jgi:diphosphomevalonate decarboxylase